MPGACARKIPSARVVCAFGTVPSESATTRGTWSRSRFLWDNLRTKVRAARNSRTGLSGSHNLKIRAEVVVNDVCRGTADAQGVTQDRRMTMMGRRRGLRGLVAVAGVISDSEVYMNRNVLLSVPMVCVAALAFAQAPGIALPPGASPQA